MADTKALVIADVEFELTPEEIATLTASGAAKSNEDGTDETPETFHLVEDHAFTYAEIKILLGV